MTDTASTTPSTDTASTTSTDASKPGDNASSEPAKADPSAKAKVGKAKLADGAATSDTASTTPSTDTAKRGAYRVIHGYVVLGPGKPHGPGSRIDLSDADAERMIALGVVELVTTDK